MIQPGYKSCVLGLLLILSHAVQAQQGAPQESIPLSEREQQLEVREAALQEQLNRHEKSLENLKLKFEAEKKALLEAHQKSEEMWKKKLSEKEKELKHQSGQLQQFQEKKMESTVQTFEKMEPKSAAKVLDDLELKFSVQILSKMKPQKSAEILSKMSPERARQVTEMSLGKRRISQEVNGVQEKSPIAPIGPTDTNTERR